MDNRGQKVHIASTASETSVTVMSVACPTKYTTVNPFDLEILTDNDLEESVRGQRNLM